MAQLITMTQKELSRYETIKRLIRREINGTQAAKQLLLSVRQVKRVKAKVIKQGCQGIVHQARGKPSNRKLNEQKINKIKRIVQQNYSDFGPTLAAEKLSDNHFLKISNEKLRQLMTLWKCWQPKSKKKNKKYRSWRLRKEHYGEMIQFDGSYHNWLEDRSKDCCLLAAIDDATGQITKLKFVLWEKVVEAFSFWKEYVAYRGKPLSIYLDKHSTYKQNLKSVFDDPGCLTQFERAMKDLGIQIIHAHSPQAKGRAERLFETLQDRLIKEMRLAGISTKEQANQFVEQSFIEAFNLRFAVTPQSKGNLHKPLTKIDQAQLDKIFSQQEQRIVNNDFTVRFEGRWYQLLEQQPALVLRKDKVLIEKRLNNEIFISLRDKCLNYKTLPARPEKIRILVPALTRTKSSWKPPANHPWRRPFILNPEKRYQTSTSNLGAP